MHLWMALATCVNVVNHQIENIQVAFSVKQKRPKNLDEVVCATLEMESYLSARTVSVTD